MQPRGPRPRASGHAVEEVLVRELVADDRAGLHARLLIAGRRLYNRRASPARAFGARVEKAFTVGVPPAAPGPMGCRGAFFEDWERPMSSLDSSKTPDASPIAICDLTALSSLAIEAAFPGIQGHRRMNSFDRWYTGKHSSRQYRTMASRCRLSHQHAPPPARGNNDRLQSTIAVPSG